MSILKFMILPILTMTALCFAETLQIAVTEFEGNVGANNLKGFSDKLRDELFNTGKFTVLERSRMNDVIKEQGFEQTGITNTDQAVKIGKLLNVTYIVTGSVNKIGN